MEDRSNPEYLILYLILILFTAFVYWTTSLRDERRQAAILDAYEAHLEKLTKDGDTAFDNRQYSLAHTQYAQALEALQEYSSWERDRVMSDRERLDRLRSREVLVSARLRLARIGQSIQSISKDGIKSPVLYESSQ